MSLGQARGLGARLQRGVKALPHELPDQLLHPFGAHWHKCRKHRPARDPDNQGQPNEYQEPFFDPPDARSVNRTQQRCKHEGRTRVEDKSYPKHVLSYREKPDDLYRDQKQEAMNARFDGGVNGRFLMARRRRYHRIVTRWGRWYPRSY